MRDGRPHPRRAPRRLVASAAAVAATALALAALLTTGAADARTQAAPTNTGLPTLAGTPTAGQTLTSSPGTWNGSTPITYTYQWQRCDSNGNNCSSLSGETTNHHELVSADVGHRLRVKVQATNSDGNATATSNASAVVAAANSGAPVNTKEPTVTGSAVVGQTLTGTAGSWSGAAPITYTYQWLRCDAQAANCAAISGQTSQTRSVTSDDVGQRLRFRVVAKNNAGSTTVDSNATSTVVASSSGVPVNGALPTISGSAVQGQILTASNGTWTGAQPITYTDQWLRCDANGNSCSSIANETKTTHTLTGDDVGHRLRVRVAAKNSSGTTTAQSEATSVVTAGSGGGGGGGQLPDGAVQLPSGKYSIPVAGVSLPTQLVVDKVKFSPNPVRSRTEPITVRVHIVDTRGYVVRDALVFIRTVPLLATTPPETPTAQDGWATMQIFPNADFPLRNRHFVQVFVRVRKADDPALAGVGTRRLVQVRTARPS